MSLQLGHDAIMPSGERFVLHVLILEQLIEREKRQISPPCIVDMIKMKTRANMPYRVKFDYLRKSDIHGIIA